MLSPLPIPTHLRKTAAGEGPDFRDWIAGLPAVVEDLRTRWGLHLGEPFEPGGLCSWVAPAKSADGDDLVLKVGWRHPEAEHEADALRLWDGDGAVRVHIAEVFDATSALLLERCTPGTPLGRVLPEPQQDLVIAELLQRLWAVRADSQTFRPLQVMCDQWAAEFETAYAASPGVIDPGLAQDAMCILRELPQSASTIVLLCTDLHGDNILAARREPWLVIDPKPYVGDPAYDVVQHMLNCDGRLAVDPGSLARRMAELLDLEPARVRLWLFARCVQESIYWPQLYAVAGRIAP